VVILPNWVELLNFKRVSYYLVIIFKFISFIVKEDAHFLKLASR